MLETLHTIVKLLFQPDSELRQIIGVTLRMSLASTAIACVLGIPLGILLGLGSFRGKKLILRLTHTLAGLPPVLAGLLVFFLLSRSGPLGRWKLLYSVGAMVLAQVLLITPIVTGLTAAAIGARAPAVFETAQGLGLSRWRYGVCLLYECRNQLFSVLFTGFGRAVSEVGAAQLVGGNVQYKTRVMTTAIVLETNMGRFDMALGLGLVLLLISFLVISAAQLLQERVS
ncbi:MAG: ABC transporter permease [Oscillospiraceae bacterium]|nr:ABC transporter permease [Oscillospiraceae bacterium]